MSQIEKLIARLKTRPANFKYSELARILKFLGYEECNIGKTSGSRVRFDKYGGGSILVHKPHPGDEMKVYAVRFIVEVLEERGEI
jgi:hypothetical protein